VRAMADRHACALLMSFVLIAPAALRAQQVEPPVTVQEAWRAYAREVHNHSAQQSPQRPQQTPQPAPPPGSTPIPPSGPGLQSFSVVLVEGDVQGSGSIPEDVPPAVRAALAEMKDFLPFKSYRLLDAGLVRATTFVDARINLRAGPDLIPPAVVLLAVRQSMPGKLQVGFKLIGSAHVIDTTVMMDVGETVIVGTSRGRGDKGLIALLTALPVKR
jgi:hypothetical protein